MRDPLVAPGETILVGTSLDAASAIALRRAVALGRTFAAHIRVVFALPWGGHPIRVVEEEQRARVMEWAARKARVVLDPERVICRLDEPATALARDALESGASLVVIGTSHARSTAGLADRLLRLAPVRVLVARLPRHRDAVVAATDLRDKRFPVARAAAAWANAYDARVTLIHNLEAVSNLKDVSRKQLWPVLRDLLHLTRALEPVRRAHLSRGVSTPAAVSELVRAQAADLLVVGSRRAGGRTVSDLLATTSSSVLVVPIGDAGR
jgi:nucleotide-binding universal stress UspA family protein